MGHMIHILSIYLGQQFWELHPSLSLLESRWGIGQSPLAAPSSELGMERNGTDGGIRTMAGGKLRSERERERERGGGGGGGRAKSRR